MSFWYILSFFFSLLIFKVNGKSCGTSDCNNIVTWDYLNNIVGVSLINSFHNSEGISFDKAIGGALRIAFHDAGAFDQHLQTGRPNGCFLIDDPGNGGLGPMTLVLSELYASLPKRNKFSRADFFQFAGIVAVETAFQVALESHPETTPPLPDLKGLFRYGRIDAPDCNATGLVVESDNTTVEVERMLLPPPHAAFDLTKEIFVDRIGISLRDLVALSGGHTLGSSTRDGSGFVGKWVSRNTELDNSYYTTIMDREWIRVTLEPDSIVDEDKFQWESPSNSEVFMLNTDLALLYNVKVNNDGCEAINSLDPRDDEGEELEICTKHTNVDSLEYQSALIFQEFAGGPKESRNVTKGTLAWYNAFVPALIKLGSVGYNLTTDLIEPCDCDPVPSDHPTISPTMSPAKTEQPTINDLLKTLKMVILLDGEYRTTYHNTTGFKKRIETKLAKGFALLDENVIVTSVVQGSVIIHAEMKVDENINSNAIGILKRDDTTLRSLNKIFESDINAGIIDPILLVRVDTTDLQITLPDIDPKFIGPFQAVNERSWMIGILSAGLVIFCTTICLFCTLDPEDYDLEQQHLEAKEQRKVDRLAALSPRAFSETALEMSYTATLDQVDLSSDDDDSSDSSDDDYRSKRSRRRRKDRKKSGRKKR